MGKMNDLSLAIQQACDNMRRVLDDDWSDAMEMEVIDIADDFNIEDTDWIEKQILAAM